ncbi:MAG TPA: TdeIII family type II restriction endonuclease [Candidatus Cloacimonadota bacterium]|jgi:hypothetical protein|nr:TdeIII family type II restriction endonuclease [Candidatus Cloacimonadota bacterium]HOR59129.1 TdeIII family type II restriction endonuclease [Candidatus Cloacimonadota bacterium]HPB08880.1 TdeIII family type II restriction endonuclease [Candidatus Cloacimonadota bacterium]HQL13531.1 TdeIII family type II restriction endonuclease [Candidatus Cloacimonadota bacterium]HQO44780.1 TdeIII family type II restriction endonuclease [Candidatus Cloacimonadota bacterium]
MPLQDNVKEKISIEIIRTLVGRFGTFPDDVSTNRNAPFHEAFLKAFSNKLGKDNINPQILISLSSWLHGLNTTLGQQFFEKVAHILSGGAKRAFTNEKISRKQKSAISDIITNLKNSDNDVVPNMIEEDELIESCAEPADDIEATNFSADVFIQDDDSIVAIELKTVKPNSGVLKEEKQKILEAKAVLRRLYPDKKVSYYIGFPFDPTVVEGEDECSFDKKKFWTNIVEGDKYFHDDEVLIASGLWDLLSGEKNTMQQLLELINRISTVEFIDIFEKIRNPKDDVKDDDYAKLLENWNLFSELSLHSNKEKILSAIKGNKRLIRSYYNPCMKEDGSYNEKRYNDLKSFI